MAAGATDFARCVVGIDFGAAHSRVALLDPSRRMPLIVRNNLTNEATPSVVAFDDTGRRHLGEDAAAKLTSRPKLACGLLRVLLQGDEAAARAGVLHPFSDGCATLSFPQAPEGEQERKYSATQLAAMLLGRLLGDARSLAGAAPDAMPEKVVVSVPDATDSAASRHITAAAAVVGVPVERVSAAGDATAAAACLRAMRYAELPAEEADAHFVGIADVGHCHSSAAVVQVWQGGIKVVAQTASPVGSRAADRALLEAALAHVKAKHKADLSGQPRALARLAKETQRAKEVLATNAHHSIRIEALTDTVDLNFPVTQEELDHMCAPLLEAVSNTTQACVQQAAAAGVPAEKLACVEVIGGGWRLPCVRRALLQHWGVSELSVHLDPVQTVAQGCALLGARRQTAAPMHVDPSPGSPAQQAAGGDDAAAAAPAGSPKQPETPAEDPTHQWEMQSPGAAPCDGGDAGELERMREVECQLAAADAAHRRREQAHNALESYVLGRREAGRRAGLEGSVLERLSSYLDGAEQWLLEHEDASAEEFSARLAEVTAQVDADYPQIKAWEEETRKADEERDRKLAEERKSQAEHKEPKTDGQRLRAAEDRKQQGVVLFKQEHWQEATHRFVQALQFLKEVYEVGNEDIKKRRDELALSCHLNIATCSIKLKRWTHAAQNCTSALEYDPSSAKAYFRRGQAQRQLNNWVQSRADLEKALELSGGDKAIQKEIDALEKAEEAHKKKEKAMYSKMFS